MYKPHVGTVTVAALFCMIGIAFVATDPDPWNMEPCPYDAEKYFYSCELLHMMEIPHVFWFATAAVLFGALEIIRGLLLYFDDDYKSSNKWKGNGYKTPGSCGCCGKTR